MKKIRSNVFETNSSSTHCLTMCDLDQYNRWVDGELYFYGEEFISSEEAEMELKKEFIRYKAAENRKGQEGYEYKGVLVDYQDLDSIFTEENLSEITKEDIEEAALQAREDGCGFFSEYEVPLTFKEYEEWLDYNSDIYESFKQSHNSVVAFGYYGEQ